MELNKKITGGLTGLSLLLGSVAPVVPPAPMPLDEIQALTAMYNYEVRMSGGQLTVENYSSLADLNDAIRKREPVEMVKQENALMTPEEYKQMREYLMSKTENTTLINKITQ